MAWTLCTDPKQSRWRIIRWGTGDRGYIGIRFEPCGVQSFHPEDVRNRYCAFCHCFIQMEAPDGQDSAGQRTEDESPDQAGREVVD